MQDPGSADTHAYRFSCDGGASWSAYGSSDTGSCATTDNGTKTVKGQVRDDDGGESAEYSQAVTVKNVAPTADLGDDGPVGEGSPATVSFSNQVDPSSTDTAAGFRYEYHCDGSLFTEAADYSSASTSPSHECTYPDGPSEHLVRARIIDKDNGASVSSTSRKAQAGATASVNA